MTRPACHACYKHTRKQDSLDTQRQRYRSQLLSFLLHSSAKTPPAPATLPSAHSLIQPAGHSSAGSCQCATDTPAGKQVGSPAAGSAQDTLLCAAGRSAAGCAPKAPALRQRATQTRHYRRPSPANLIQPALGSAQTGSCFAPDGYAGAPLSAPRSAERSRGMQCTFRMSGRRLPRGRHLQHHQLRRPQSSCPSRQARG